MTSPFSFLLRGLLLLSLFGMLVGCASDTEAELRRKEQEQLEKCLAKPSLTFYKALKVAMRSSADTSLDPEMSAAASTILKLGLQSGSLALDTSKTISITELLGMARDFYRSRDILVKKNEDDLPTVLENISLAISGKRMAPPVFGSFTYDKNFEHVVLGLLWTASVKAPAEFPLYELNQAEITKIPFRSVRALTGLSKSLSFSLNNFNWHCLDESALYTQYLEAEKAEFLKSPFLLLPGSSTPQQSYYQWHLMGAALHGISHLELEHEEEAMKDFDVVLSDAEKGGVDNEIIWLVGAYVHIKNEEKEKAITDLTKLQQSQMMDAAEKQAIAEGIHYLEARDNKKAFLKVRDKLALSGIGFRLFRNRVKELEQIKQIQSSAEGHRLFSVQEKLLENSGNIIKISDGIGIDSLAAGAKNLVKDLFGK